MAGLQRLLMRLNERAEELHDTELGRYLFDYGSFESFNCSEYRNSSYIQKFPPNEGKFLHTHNHFILYADTSLVRPDSAIALLGKGKTGKSILTGRVGRRLTRDETLIVFVRGVPYLIPGKVRDEHGELKSYCITAAYGIIPVVHSKEPEIVSAATAKMALLTYVDRLENTDVVDLAERLDILGREGVRTYYLLRPTGKITETAEKLKNHALKN